MDFKKIAIIVAVVVVVGAITVWALANWTDVIDNVLCMIQKNIGLQHHFHLNKNYVCP